MLSLPTEMKGTMVKSISRYGGLLSSIKSNSGGAFAFVYLSNISELVLV